MDKFKFLKKLGELCYSVRCGECPLENLPCSAPDIIYATDEEIQQVIEIIENMEE